MKNPLSLPVLLLAATLAISGCADVPMEQAGPGEGIDNYESFKSALEARTLEVEFEDEIVQDFFDPAGKLISVDGEEIQVFEFPSQADAVRAAGSISPEGSSIGTTMVTWIAPPHFYQSGNLIVIYVGTDADTILMLEELLGEQLAGS